MTEHDNLLPVGFEETTYEVDVPIEVLPLEIAEMVVAAHELIQHLFDAIQGIKGMTEEKFTLSGGNIISQSGSFYLTFYPEIVDERPDWRVRTGASSSIFDENSPTSISVVQTSEFAADDYVLACEQLAITACKSGIQTFLSDYLNKISK